MKATEATFAYYIQKHDVYTLREQEGPDSPEAKRAAGRLVRLRRHLEEDGGIELTRLLDAKVAQDRAREKMLQEALVETEKV